MSKPTFLTESCRVSNTSRTVSRSLRLKNCSRQTQEYSSLFFRNSFRGVIVWRRVHNSSRIHPCESSESSSLFFRNSLRGVIVWRRVQDSNIRIHLSRIQRIQFSFLSEFSSEGYRLKTSSRFQDSDSSSLNPTEYISLFFRNSLRRVVVWRRVQNSLGSGTSQIPDS